MATAKARTTRNTTAKLAQTTAQTVQKESGEMIEFTNRLRQYAEVMEHDYSVVVADELKEAANLIDQQQAEIEKLHKMRAIVADAHADVLGKKQAEIERLRENVTKALQIFDYAFYSDEINVDKQTAYVMREALKGVDNE